jgi:hypothetical protein
MKNENVKNDLLEDWGDLKPAKLENLITFEPTNEMVMFKSFITQIMSMEDLMELVMNPELFSHKFKFFAVDVVSEWCKNPLFCAWLCIENFSSVYLELKHLDYIKAVEAIAENAEELDPKSSQLKLAAYKTLLDERRSSKPQNKKLEDASQMMRAVPKTLAKLSSFELHSELKSLEKMVEE